MTNETKLSIVLDHAKREERYRETNYKSLYDYFFPKTELTGENDWRFYLRTEEEYTKLQNKTYEACVDAGLSDPEAFREINEARIKHAVRMNELRNDKHDAQFAAVRAEAGLRVGVARRALKKAQAEYDEAYAKLLSLDD